MANQNIRYIFVRTNSNTMDYKVISSKHPEELTGMVRSHIEQGWKPVGSHQVVITHIQNQYVGSEFIETEYSQTMIKE